METKHTPGPWVNLPGSAKVLAGTVSDNGYEGHEICWPAKGRNRQEAISNARLIASAPELLEALKVCQVRVFMAEGCSPAYEQARVAIDRAIGQRENP